MANIANAVKLGYKVFSLLSFLAEILVRRLHGRCCQLCGSV